MLSVSCPENYQFFAFRISHFAPLAGRACPGPRGTEVGGSGGQSLEFHALYINVIRRQTVITSVSNAIGEIIFMSFPEFWIRTYVIPRLTRS